MNSRTHAAIVLKGTTTRNGPGTCRSYIVQPRNQIGCNVFPKPISAARVTFLLLDHEKANQFKPARQYSRCVRPSPWRKLGCLAIRLNLGPGILAESLPSRQYNIWVMFPANSSQLRPSCTLLDVAVVRWFHYYDERRIELPVMMKVSVVVDSRLCIQSNVKR
jgi:hypothetical protein